MKTWSDLIYFFTLAVGVDKELIFFCVLYHIDNIYTRPLHLFLGFEPFTS